MKYLSQFTVILGFSFCGELLHSLLPFPIPASVYGMVLLFAALMSGLVKVEQVGDTGRFLVGIMTVMFVSPAVGILNCWDVIAPALVPILCIVIVSLVLVFGVSGRVTQYFIERKEKNNG